MVNFSKNVFLLRARNCVPLELAISRCLSTKQIIYEENGDPTKVLKIKSCELEADNLKKNDVLIKWQAAPVNPADINQIQGVYAIRPPLPAVAGNEGCAIVQAIGADVNSLAVGDIVIPARSGLGTWTEYGIYAASALHRVFTAQEEKAEITAIATIQVNPSTAYRMLHDFVQLSSGDCVVQNGGNSAVGRYVIQICRLLGLKSINVVRDRESIGDMKRELSELGADEVFTEEEFSKAARNLKDVNLALNNVGGRSSLNLARVLAPHAYMVTYGGMSKQPVQAPTGPLIFNDISLRGFWMSRWYDIEANKAEREKMYAQLFAWYKNGQLQTPPMKERKFDEKFAEAFNVLNDRKQLFLF